MTTHDADDRAFRLWCWYEMTTETYDRSICTGPIVDGGIVPGNDFERERSTRNAMLSLRIVRAEEIRLGITVEESREGRKQAERFSGDLDRLRAYARAPHASAPPKAVLRSRR